MKIQTTEGLKDTSELTRGYSSINSAGNIALSTNWYTKGTKRLVRKDVQYYVDSTVLGKDFNFMENCNSVRALQVDGTPVTNVSLPTPTKYNIGISEIDLYSGFAYVVSGPFGVLADTDSEPSRSLLRVFENGVELTAHTAKATVSGTGLGTFIHWSLPDNTQEVLIFSTTDNSDPRFNGRSYTYGYTEVIPEPTPIPDPGPPPPVGSSAPTIVSISTSNITTSSITITVVLDMVAQLYIQYGTTSQYGQESAHELSFDYSTHTQTISGLLPGTEYHFRVRAMNSSNQETVSPDNTFTTVAASTGTVTLVTDKTAAYTEPAIARPNYLITTIDPTFHTKVTRISGDSGSSFSFSSGGSAVWQLYSRHKYSKAQAWNADQSLIAFIQAGHYVYIDGATYKPKFQFPMHADDRWHNVLPGTRISAGGNLLEWFNAATNVQTRFWPLPFSVLGIGNNEGNTSQDGRFVALHDATRAFIVDMDPQAPLASYASGNKRIGPVLNVSAGGTIDWISVSPSGKYMVVQYDGPHTRVFDINPTTLAISPRVLPVGANQCSTRNPADGYLSRLGHADMALNPFDGNEDVIVGQAVAGCPNAWGALAMIRLKDGLITPLLSSGSSATMAHVSTRNIQRPGWVYVDFYDPANYQWDAAGLRFDDELVAVKLDGTGSVERLAHLHSLTTTYDAQPQATASPDGLRALWASNWRLKGNGPGDTDIKAYVVDTRA